jgi:hypothetical protein
LCLDNGLDRLDSTTQFAPTNRKKLVFTWSSVLYCFVVLSSLFFATTLLKTTVVFCSGTPLANESLVQWAMRDQYDGTAEYGLLQPLVDSWPVNFPAVYGLGMPNAVDWRSIHHHYAGLGKAHTSCETLHEF